MHACSPRKLFLRQSLLDPDGAQLRLLDGRVLFRAAASRFFGIRGITRDEALDLYRDGLGSHASDASDLHRASVPWTDALVTAAERGLLRPFDIERALGVDFVEARSGDGWRTLPILIRLPRFVAEAIRREPMIPRRLPLPHRIERILFEQYRNAHTSGGVAPGPP